MGFHVRGFLTRGALVPNSRAVAVTVSPVVAGATIALAIFIQQLENYLLVPMIIKKSVGLSPVITLISLLIGFKVAGVVGALLSVPVVIILHVLFTEFLHKPSKL